MFKDPIESQKETALKRTPWDFSAPAYDARSSCFINAGTHYGVGYNQPVGKMSASSNSPIPKGRVQTQRIDESSHT